MSGRRINPTVSNDAKKIYDNWGQGERGHKTSEAIIRYEYNSLEKKVNELEKRIEKLEGGL